jgi:succinate dehydrogenase hydrophobic anchor subunit
MEWFTAGRRVAGFLIPYTAGYLTFRLARPLIEQAVGTEVMQALSNIALAVFIAVAIIALTPAVVVGLREIIGERVTGPLRPPPDAEPSADSSASRS